MNARAHAITEPFGSGMLDVGEGHSIRWQTSGNPEGKPAVLLHGGPGSGSSPNMRQLFDPERYLIVQFDQRNCGESTPSASLPAVDLSTNTTQALVADVERLRAHLGISRWLVWGGSWGTTLGLAYAEAHPGAVTALVLASVVTTSAAEVEWTTRTMGRVFPERWQAFLEGLPTESRDGNLALAYSRRLMDPDPAVHEPAAIAWCEWEDTHISIAEGFRPNPRFDDPAFRLTFSRLVTHYWAHAGYLEEGQLLRDSERLVGVPVFMVHGRRDISAPADIPLALARAIPGAELFIAESAGHGGSEMMDWLVSTLDALAPPEAASAP